MRHILKIDFIWAESVHILPHWNCFHVHQSKGFNLLWNYSTSNDGTGFASLLYTLCKLTALNRNCVLTDVVISPCCSVRNTCYHWSVKSYEVLLGRYYMPTCLHCQVDWSGRAMGFHFKGPCDFIFTSSALCFLCWWESKALTA